MAQLFNVGTGTYNPFSSVNFVSTNPAVNPYAQNSTNFDNSYYNFQNVGNGEYDGGPSAWVVNNGDVQGTSTSGGESPTPTIDPNQQIYNNIASGWDSYINTLDQQISGLGGQQQSQENIINSQYDTGVNELDTYKNLAIGDLGAAETKANQNQAKNLKDLSSNIANLFKSGNNYLGTLGAGDSSAANQYAYALTKLGTRGRSDITQNTANILGDINMRKAKISEIYGLERTKLSSLRDQKLNEIAIWFSEAQRNLQLQKSQAGLSKEQDLASMSQNLLNTAISYINSINSGTTQAAKQLEQWALGQIQNIGATTQGLQSLGSTSYAYPTAQNIAGGISSGGGMSSLTWGGGFGSDDNQFYNA